jgi:hypothetical protein
MTSPLSRLAKLVEEIRYYRKELGECHPIAEEEFLALAPELLAVVEVADREHYKHDLPDEHPLTRTLAALFAAVDREVGE